MNKRSSGILLHITSLPSPYGIGDLGPWAYRFADFLAETRQSYWQILPLNPTDPASHHSPYNSISAFGSNPLLISPEGLIEDGFLLWDDIRPLPDFDKEEVDYDAVVDFKKRILDRAWKNFKKMGHLPCEYESFRSENIHWLDDFGLFAALKEHYGGLAWNTWPIDIKDRQSSALALMREQLHDRIERHILIQFLTFLQWKKLKDYCNQLGIHLIGDLPIYVQFDSADIWIDPNIVKLDSDKKQTALAGVPPDYFSSTGQLWGNPVYRWDVLKQTGYSWWMKRLAHVFSIYDIVRIDHFRGLVAYWEVPAGENTAINGEWVEVPSEDFFNALLRRFGFLPVIAEDLGVITPDVREIMAKFDFAGMKVLLFAFGDDLAKNPYIPHNVNRNSVIYTGTHDTNTVCGWFKEEADKETRERLFEYLGHEVRQEDIHWEMIREAMRSVADTAIIPMQDLLGLGEESRMNFPSRRENNWKWRLTEDSINQELITRLKEMTKIYGRA